MKSFVNSDDCIYTEILCLGQGNSSTISQKLTMRFQRSIAFIVGIDNYRSGIPLLRTPVCDAQALAEILQNQHGYETYLLINEQAKKEDWLDWFEKKLPQLVGVRDRLLFYFAGHGIALNGNDGPEGYLIPQDAITGNVSTYVPMNVVHNALDNLPCRHFIGILDCCFAGSFRWASTRDITLIEPGVVHKERFDRFVQDPAWQIITSASYDQTALDAFCLQTQRGQAGNHSPFAAALIEALEGGADAYPAAEAGKPAGDGVITASELYMYLRDRVETATESKRLRQTPGLHPMKKHDKGEFIFFTPGHVLNLPPAPPLDESHNPYRGLQTFEPQHSALFFGRSELTHKLKDFVLSHPLTVVQGASGSGKSSLVKAGLIPKLRECIDNKWLILSSIRPGDRPFQALNTALATAGLATVDIKNSDRTLTGSIAAWSKENPQRQLLLFVDQCEEIVTLCVDGAVRQAFFQQVLTAINDHQAFFRVVLTLRADFEPQVREAGLKFAPKALGRLGRAALESYWQQGRFIVPMMSRAELRAAIEKPAEARVMHFEPHSLVEQLIDEVVDMPGALPLLSFALSELYLKYLERQHAARQNNTLIDRALTQSDYEALGGVIQSLTQRANQEYDMLVSKDAEYRQAVRHVMLRMVAAGGGEIARRRVPLSELEYPSKKNRLTRTIVERFSAARLLTSGQDIDGKPYVEPAHDALVRGWDKLQTWLSQAKDLSLQRRLTPSAIEWNEQQQGRFLWHANPYLDVLSEDVLNSSHNNWLNKTETEFVQQSIAKRRHNRMRLGASVLGVLAALGGFSLFAGYQWRQAEIGRIEALLESSEANFTLNRSSFDALTDALTASKRLSEVPFGGVSDTLKRNVLSALVQSVGWVREENRLLDHQDAVLGISFSPDGELLATGSNDRTVKLWRLDGSHVKTLGNYESEVLSVSFGPDSQLIATGDADGELKIWDRDGTLIQTIPAHTSLLLGISFSSQGTVATASADGTVGIWRIADGQRLDKFEGHQSSMRQVEISLEGDRVAALNESGELKLWIRGEERPIKTFDDSNFLVSLNISRDGQFLTTVSEDGNVERWDWDGELVEPSKQLVSEEGIWFADIDNSDSGAIATASATGNLSIWSSDGRLLDTWIGHYGPVASMSFSADGQTLVSAGINGTIKFWQIHRDRLKSLEGYPNNLFDAEFSLDGEQIAGATAYGSIRIWKKDGEWTADEDIHDSQVNTLAFSPSENIMASGSNSGKMKLVDKDTLREIMEIDGHDDRVMSVSFSPNGDLIASGSADSTVEVWNMKGENITSLEDSARVLSVEFSPNGEKIAAGGDALVVKLWNLQGQIVETLVGHTGEIRGISFSPDGTTIATASDDRTVKLWRPDGSLIKTLDGHRAAVQDVRFSPNGEIIASGSSDRTIKLWRSDGTLIATLTGSQGSIRTVNFSPDSRWLVSTSADQNALLWDISEMNIQNLQAKGCRQLKNYLDHQAPKNETNELKELCI